MLAHWRGALGHRQPPILIEWGTLEQHKPLGCPRMDLDLYVLHLHLPAPHAVAGVNGCDILRLEPISTAP